MPCACGVLHVAGWLVALAAPVEPVATAAGAAGAVGATLEAAGCELESDAAAGGELSRAGCVNDAGREAVAGCDTKAGSAVAGGGAAVSALPLLPAQAGAAAVTCSAPSFEAL